MIRLVHGKGQLGGALNNIRNSFNNEYSIKKFYIYHTWNVWDKSEEAQLESYNDFKKFVDSHKEGKIIFISTKTKEDTPYLKYKIKSEDYLDFKKDLVVRLPNIIGKGVCAKFRDEDVVPYGRMELIRLNDAAFEIMKNLSLVGLLVVEGNVIDASIVKELIKFGGLK